MHTDMHMELNTLQVPQYNLNICPDRDKYLRQIIVAIETHLP